MTNNAINSNIPIEVTKGGTQASSFVAYAPVVGGVTSTGALQSVASAGTTGQVLVSQGNAALPIWANASGFTDINIQTFTSSGTYTPSVGMVKCIVEVQGAGGGGGGAEPTNVSSALNGLKGGGGGGGGSYCKQIFTSTVGPQTISIGQGGLGGDATGTNGQDGGATTFGSLMSANGGKGGAGSLSGGITPDGGVGGSATGGFINIDGSCGTTCFQTSIPSPTNATYNITGNGGGSFYAGSSQGIGEVATAPGRNGLNYGGGGSGAISNAWGSGSNQPGNNGGTGAPGIVIVTEYIG